MNIITDISEVTLMEVFTDDHTPCAHISFKDQDGQMHEIELFCIGAEGVGACKYANDSMSAKQDLLKLIQDQWDADEESRLADLEDADAAMGDPTP